MFNNLLKIKYNENINNTNDKNNKKNPNKTTK